MPDDFLIRDGPVAVPLSYTVPQSGELLPLTVRATVDGTAAASAFYATVQIVAPSGRIMANGISSSIAAGASADVTWFPFRPCPPAANWPNTLYAGAVLAFGPWGYWKLNEAVGAGSVADSSGHGRTLTPNGANWSLGHTGLIRSNTDTCAYSSVSGVSTVNGYNTLVNQLWTPAVASVELWFQTPGNGANQLDLCCIGTFTGSTTRLFSVILSATGQPIFQYQDNTGTLQTINVPVGVTDNSVHQLVFVLDGSHLTTYKDGAQADQQVQPAAMKSNFSQGVTLGQPPGSSGARAYLGFLGPCAFYDKVLSSANVATLYATATTIPT